MISYAWYGLQVITCSGIMMIYYWFVLRNKRFHQYNRFYILTSVFLSFLIPVIKIQLENGLRQKGVGHLIYVFADYNASIENAISVKNYQVNWYMVSLGIYMLISIAILVTFLSAFIKIYRLLKGYPGIRIGDALLVLTNVEGTPFSFFRFVFWNNEIDIQSVTGQQILKHELIHVKEKHSIDTMIMQLVLMIGWINSFFWLANKELNMIHEFAADRQSVPSSDTASFAAMLLMTAYPRQQYSLTHTFFFSPIKRRLLMLTTNKNPRYSYVRRIIALPLIAVVMILFAFKAEYHHNYISPIKSAKNLFSARLLDTLIIRDSTGVLKESKANVTIINNVSGGKDTIITIFKGSSTKSEINGTGSIRKSVVIIGKPSQSDPLYLIEGKISESGLMNIKPDEVSSVNVLKDYSSIAKYGEAGKNGVIEIVTKQSKVFYDGKIVGNDALSTTCNLDTPHFAIQDRMKDIKPDEIRRIDNLKGDSATRKYADKGKNGVIIVTTKRGSF